MKNGEDAGEGWRVAAGTANDAYISDGTLKGKERRYGVQGTREQDDAQQLWSHGDEADGDAGETAGGKEGRRGKDAREKRRHEGEREN